MTFSQLSHFKVVCDLGSIRKAAEHLHVSSPAISVSIKNLEQEFDIHLFLRSGSKMFLTDEGRRFYSEVEQFLQEYDRIAAVAQDMGKDPHVIRYGTVPLAGSYLTPSILYNFYSKYPNEKVLGQEGTPDELVAKVLSGEIDVMLAPKREWLEAHTRPGNDLEYLVVKQEAFVLATYQKHPLADRRQISVFDIIEEPLVLLHGSYIQSALIDEMFALVGATPNVIYRTGQQKTIERFVTQGIASAFMYLGLISEVDGVVGIPVKEMPVPIVDILLVWRKRQYMFSSVQRFIRSVRELIPYL